MVSWKPIGKVKQFEQNYCNDTPW